MAGVEVMWVVDGVSLPEDGALAQFAVAVEAAGSWCWIFDRHWRHVHTSVEMRLGLAGLGELAPTVYGVHPFSPDGVQAWLAGRFGWNTPELVREAFLVFGPMVLADTPGGRDELRASVDPLLHDLIDELQPEEVPIATTLVARGATIWGNAPTTNIVVRIRNSEGVLVGTAVFNQPAVSMTTMATLAAHGDVRHFERMLQVAKAGRRPAAVLFADLDGSTPLAKRLATASYFAFCRRFVRVADASVIDEGGLIGRHAGDGVVGFFLAEMAGSESAAARACISAARSLQLAIGDVADRSNVESTDVVLRFGLHWGATLYVGQLTTPGRTEVAALGDEVNETARIEACATGGRILASKALIERLDQHDAADLGIDPQQVAYTRLADLGTATDKARRDAPTIPVCDLASAN